MGTCRCEVLNVMSGAVAREYVDVHLQRVRTDGMGRAVHRCETSEVEWLEERGSAGYDHEATVLRRMTR